MAELLEYNEKNIEKCVTLLQGGDIVAFPTETVYGLGADVFNATAVEKVFIAKGRPPINPLTVHVSNMQQIEQVAYVTEMADKLIRAFMPGPLTIILKKKECVPSIVTAGGDTVGVRMPSHKVALSLINRAGAIVGTSANSSSRPSPTTAAHVLADIGGRIPALLDSGACDVGVESTIIDLTGEPRVLRLGGLELAEIERVLGVSIDSAMQVSNTGMGYKSKLQVKLFDYGIDMINQIISAYDEASASGVTVAILCSAASASKYDGRKLLVYGESESDYAKNLFALIHTAEKEYQEILAEGLIEKGIGVAVLARLRKMQNTASKNGQEC